MPGVSLGVAVRMLPTPTASDTFTDNLKSSQQKPGSMHSVTLPQAVKLLPTPVASEGTKAPSQQNTETKSKTGQVWLSNAAQDMKLNWGQYEPAIRQWEQVTGQPAPAPTQPDGKDGNHRLSAAFTEWLMGLPKGWITDVELTRNQMLKACGNGVVPQQAALALEILDPQESHA